MKTSVLAAAATFLWLVSTATAQPCTPHWDDSFARGDPLGNVRAQAIFDDGTGPHLYAGDSTGIWRWDGLEWSLIGSLASTHTRSVRALTVFDDGTGPALYAGGDFASIDSIQGTGNLARWDGSDWTSVSAFFSHNMPTSTSEFVRALAVHDDGSGPALYVGGGFDRVNGILVNRIARFDGTQWHALGEGFTGINAPDPHVYTLATFNGDLYAAGGFRQSGSTILNGIARWDGNAWRPLGTGLGNRAAFAMTVWDDGTGPRLVVGGDFSNAGSMFVSNIASWNGTVWSALHMPYAGTNGGVRALYADPHPGSSLYIGGWFTSAFALSSVNGIVQLSASGAEPLGSGLGSHISSNRPVHSIIRHDDGAGAHIVAGGNFDFVGDLGVNSIGRWDGAKWTAVGEPRRGALGIYHKLWSLRDSGGAALFAGGLTSLGSLDLAGAVARFDGDSWSVLGGMPRTEIAQAMAAYDTGSGPELFAAWQNLGTSPGPITRWDGSQWQTFATVTRAGSPSSVSVMAVYDDGSGAQLYIGGAFDAVNGQPYAGIARWNGASWEGVGGGVSGQIGGSGPSVLDMELHDGALYISGRFTHAGGVSAPQAARWDGAWSGFGEPPPSISGPGHILNLAEVQTPTGPVLLCNINLHPSPVYRLTPEGWTPYTTPSPGGFGPIIEFDLGDGPMLYTGPPNIVNTGGLYRWNDGAWEIVAGGTSAAGPRVMAVFKPDAPGSRASLWMLGSFESVGDGVDAYRIAALHGCAGVCYANCDGSTTEPILTVDDFMCFINEFALASTLPIEEQIPHYANCDNSTTPPILTVDDFVCFIDAFAQGCL